jgi:hypothetical protein
MGVNRAIHGNFFFQGVSVDLKHERDVAIKALHPDLGEPKGSSHTAVCT